MALKLNEPKEAYREFYGRTTEQMPELIDDCRIPMSVAGLMQRRLDVRNSYSIKSSYMDNCFSTGDAVVYHPDGRVKIVLDSEDLRALTPKSPINGGALILGEDVYKALEGEEFKKRELGKIENCLFEKDVKAHPVWRALARDQALLNDYANYIFAEEKEKCYDTAMRIYLGSAKGETPEMRSWLVYWLGEGSNIHGELSLDYNCNRLIGITPEALGGLEGRSVLGGKHLRLQIGAEGVVAEK